MSEAKIFGADLTVVGALLAEPARVAMLTALWGGVALPASELATRAAISPSTASTHLNRLLAAQWVTVEQRGRHRYFRLASAEIAQLLEHLACVAPIAPVRSLNAHQTTNDLRIARACYDHLAGWVGVALTSALLTQDLLRSEGTSARLTDQGAAFLRDRGVELPPATSRRAYARFCLDWSERRDHVAGAVGAAILHTWIAQRWVERTKPSRALRMTGNGIAQLAEWGVSWPPPEHA